jgi:hypothetical protein
MKIALYKGRGRTFNRLVSWWTRSIYSHCEVLFDYAPATDQWYCASSSFLDGGIRFKWIKLDPANWDIIDIDADRLKVYSWFLMNQGRSYDVKGIVGCVIRIIPPSTDKYFCSSAIAAALDYPDHWRVLPVNLDNLSVYQREVAHA